MTTRFPYSQMPHRYCGSSSDRQGVGDPGHCEDCCSVGHVVAHPDLGCGDVGCTRDHPDPTPTPDTAPPTRPNYDTAHDGLAIISDGTPDGQIKALADSLRTVMAERDNLRAEVAAARSVSGTAAPDLRAQIIAALCIDHGHSKQAGGMDCRTCARRADAVMSVIDASAGSGTAALTDAEEFIGCHHPAWPDPLQFRDEHDARRWFDEHRERQPQIKVRRRVVTEWSVWLAAEAGDGDE